MHMHSVLEMHATHKRNSASLARTTQHNNILNFHLHILFFNRLSKGGGYTFRLFTFLLMFDQRYFSKNDPILIIIFSVGKISVSLWSRS